MSENAFLAFSLPSPITEIKSELLEDKRVQLYIKREDQIHPWLSGNKYRKLKYNILKAGSEGKSTFITFGGAFSNHLYAMAGAGKLFGLKTIGIVRGEIDENNPTLRFCKKMGMSLFPVSRKEYRRKESSDEIKEIISQYPESCIIPEGGTNELALKGVSEMLDEMYQQMTYVPDIIALSCGTGGTTAGILSHLQLGSRVLAFSSLKSDHLYKEILTLAGNKNNALLSVQTDYHFDGYGHWDDTLLDFIAEFENNHQIPLDHVYNGKAMYGLFDMIKKDQFSRGTSICFIHTGGLQGKYGLEYIQGKRSIK